MCDVCNEHNAYGLEDSLELEEEDLGTECHECRRRINYFEEKVHVWRIHDHQHPCGFRSIPLCNECHKTRTGGRLE